MDKTKSKNLKVFLVVLILVAVIVTIVTNIIRKDDTSIKLMSPKEFQRTAVDLNLAFKSNTNNTEGVNGSYIATSDISSINIEFMVFEDSDKAEKFYISNKEGKTKIIEQDTKNSYARYEYEYEDRQYDLYRVENTVIIISNNSDDSTAKEKITEFKEKIMIE